MDEKRRRRFSIAVAITCLAFGAYFVALAITVPTEWVNGAPDLKMPVTYLLASAALSGAGIGAPFRKAIVGSLLGPAVLAAGIALAYCVFTASVYCALRGV